MILSTISWARGWYINSCNIDICTTVILSSTKSFGAVGSFQPLGIHMNPNVSENTRKACLCLQPTTSASITVDMKKQREVKAIGKAVEEARRRL